MRAIVVAESGVALRDLPTPKPKPPEVLVRVRAVSLNRADLGIVAGHRHGPAGGAGTVPGIEWAGEVVDLGSEVSDIRIGERVMCSGMGGYAEYAVTDWGRMCPIPPSMSFEAAATLPIALSTMHDAVVTNGRLTAGESILVQGASSGVGLMALQIARLRGASVIVGTSTRPERRARLAEFGATLAFDSKDPTWPDQVVEATGGRGVDVIIDQVSAGVAEGNMKAAAVLGRIINVGRLGGTKGEFNFDLHALKRISYIGVTFRTRTIDEIREIVRRMRQDLWGAVEREELWLPIDRVFSLEDAPAALAHMRANAHFGKILLAP